MKLLPQERVQIFGGTYVWAISNATGG